MSTERNKNLKVSDEDLDLLYEALTMAGDCIIEHTPLSRSRDIVKVGDLAYLSGRVKGERLTSVKEQA